MPAVVGLDDPLVALEKLQLAGDRLEVQAEVAAVLPLLDAPAGPHPQEQVLPRPLCGGDGLNVHRSHQAASGQVAGQVPRVGVALTVEVGVGAGAEAHVLPAHPVFQVVAGFLTRLGEVGDLILMVARLPQPVHGGEIKIGLVVSIGQF